VGVVPLLLFLGAAACEGPFEPPTGSLELRVTTVGVDLDADGYAFSVDSGASQPIAVNAVDSIPGLGIGQHNVTLSGLAINCALGGSASRTVDVRTGTPAVVTFSVSCSPLVGSVHATTTTSGADVDLDGYLLTVDGGSSHPIAANGIVDVPDLSVGTHQLTLSGVAGNCSVGQPNPRSANVSYATTTAVSFVVTCNASTGAVQVTTTTSGTDLDPDGYSAIVDGAGGPVVATNGTVTISGLSPGAHSITLTAVAPNCTVTPPNPRAVTVTVGATTPVAFDISCTATNGTLRVITSTTGTSLDHDGYTVLVDEYCDYYYGCYYGWSEPAAVNDTVMIAPIPNGGHTVWLSNMAANCTVAGANPVTATVVAGDTTTVAFAVTCAPAGSVAVTAATTGIDLDPNGYSVLMDGNFVRHVDVNGVVTIPDVPEGDHVVQLGDVAPNCSVAGSNPDTIHVTVNDTARLTFQVTCASRFGTLQVSVATSGANLDPDGYTVLVDEYCDYYYGCYYGWTEPSALNDTIVIPNVPVGPHTVSLSGLAANCTVTGPNPVTASVPSADTGRIVFTVTCAPAGTVAVTAVTTGVDLDAGGYTVQVDSSPSALLPTNGVAIIRDVPEGDHAVQLGAVDQNCSVTGSNPVTIHVTANDTARTTFQINCVSIHGTLRVIVATSGANIDPNGYTVTVDYACDDYYGCYYLWSEVVAVNDTITIPNVLVGNHTVELMDVAQNCAVQGPNPVIAAVLSGATTTVTLQVACVVEVNR
jgi:hypothetical protein